jgi:hypothetical protein
MYVVQNAAEASEEVLVEQAEDNANPRMDGADHQRGGDIDEVIIGENQDAACLGDIGSFQHGTLAAIAVDESCPPQTFVVGRTTIIDDDDV